MGNQNRIVSLDWLRGIMALSILFYHISDFTFTQNHALDSGSILGRLGIYAVSIFFILSGLSMTFVYHSKINTIENSFNFFVRRFFRLLPLLWIVCILKIVFLIYFSHDYAIKPATLLLNFTGLFGFVKPGAYIPLGAWSIGNELVYYALTPIIFYIYNKKIVFGNLFFLFTLLIGAYFCFIAMDSNHSLSDQWHVYINPFNNFFFYVSGIFMYYNFKSITFSKSFTYSILIISFLLFTFLPVHHDLIHIVTGTYRMIFFAISFLIVLAFYKFNISVPQIVDRPMEKLGIATYGVYLIHPIVHMYVGHYISADTFKNQLILFILVTIITIPLSLYSFYYMESKIMILAKKVTYPQVIKRFQFSKK
jgi:exopolysaccharide production protein ExoZ